MVASGSAFAMDGGGVSISGSANFGVKFKENDGGANAPNELQFHHEFDIKFSASGTTDGGIGFGGSMSIDNREDVASTSSKTSVTTRGRTSGNVVVSDGSAELIFIEDLTVGGTLEAPAISFTFAEAQAATRGVTIENGDAVIYHAGADNTNGRLEVVKAAKWAELNGTPGPAPADASGNKAIAYWDTVSTTEIETSKADKVNNHGEVYISMDMHKLTIGTDLDRGDQVAGGLKDVGFDGIGIDDEAERVWAKTARDVRYDGDFGIAKVAFTYGDNKGDAEWAAGFSFNVEPVKVGAGFDSNGVISVGMGFTQGQISMNALYSTDSDSDEADNEAGQLGWIEYSTAALSTGKADELNPNKPDLKNQAMGVDMTYKMSDATSLILVVAQHKSESASWNGAKATVGEADEVPTAPELADLPAITAADAVDGKWVTKSTTVDAFGVGFEHDLGGGATLSAGAGSVDSNAVADLGISMKF
ncbi:MAG: hypothetical protein OXE84_09620 [Rhodobacteraceae bacterium]|nr:hypothetical protein [Paracoccaceae bacterium]MCY4328244.1 hypothetical protein [Paracoccaceae bacterium]